LDICSYNSIESLPATIGQVQHLTELRLVGCGNRKEVLQSIASLFSLSMLDLFLCKSIESLPTMIGQLQHLIELQLTGYENLNELLQSIPSLFSLSMLDLSTVIPLNHY
jgi:hypothetical protein